MQQLEFDFGSWDRELFPRFDAAIQSRGRELAEFLCTDSPVSIVASEHFRNTIIGSNNEFGSRVPVDRFVFGKGEPPKRFHTKVGGVPFRPRSVQWPLDKDGVPMVFLVQFCFTDSADHLIALPGDVLLVFIRAFRGFLTGNVIPDPCDREASLFLEWYPKLLDDVVEQEGIPAAPFTVPCRYAIRYRSSDLTDDARAITVARRVLPPQLIPGHEFLVDATLSAIFRHRGMKIGGVPYRFGIGNVQRNERFVASFGGVDAVRDFPYPWANQREPLSIDEGNEPENFFGIRNGACIDFFVNGLGKTTWDGVFL
jgi:hypothetical protein